MRINLTGAGLSGRSLDVNAQRRINLYYVPNAGSERAPGAYYGTPGLVSFCNTGTGAAVIGLHPYNGKLYAVAGGHLYEVTTAGAKTDKGAMTLSNAHASMADNGAANGHQLMIAGGANGYIYDSTADTLTQIAAAGFPGADFTTFLDGCFIVNKPNSGEFFKSGIYDGTVWDATQFATAEGSPDNLLRVFADHETLRLFGEISTETWYDTGGADFPYERYSGGFSQTGCIAPATVARLHGYSQVQPGMRNKRGGLAWLGRNQEGQVSVYFGMTGRDITALSDTALDWTLGQYSTLSDAFAFTYQMNGREFYVLTFPTEGHTWVYDAVTTQWHEWSSAASYTPSRHIANCHAFFNGKHYIGGTDGVIYELSDTAYDDAGSAIYRRLDGVHIQHDRDRIFIRSLEVNFESGVGSSSLDPSVTLRWSKDRGHTFNAGKTVTVGKSGDNTKRAIVRRLGEARDFVFSLEMNDAVKWVILDGTLKLRGQ